MIQLRGVIYEVDTVQDMYANNAYMSPNSKSYFLCRADGKIYEKTITGSYDETRDFDAYVKKSHSVEQSKSTQSAVEQSTMTFSNSSVTPGMITVGEHQYLAPSTTEEVVAMIEHLAQHVYHVNFKVNEVIGILNPKVLPEDIHERYNPEIKKTEE